MMVENFLSLSFFCSIVIRLLPHTEGAVNFTKEPDNPSYVKKGNNATLVWDYSVTDRQTELKFIIWAVYYNNQFHNLITEYKNGYRVIASSIPSAYNGRIGIEGRASLVIGSIALQDNTIFRCILGGEPAVALLNHTSTIRLIVTVPVQFTTLPQNLTVNETNPIVVSCDALGFPEPSFTWRKDGQVLSQSKQLNIQRTQRSDAGMYVCTAGNGVGHDKTANAYVTIQYLPTIKAVTTSTNKSWIGQTVKLTCESDGVPTPTLTWYKPDGSQINSVTATRNTVNAKMSVDQDFGNYKCDADNGLNPADFKTVKITQIKKPGSPAIAQSDIQATSLRVKWTAPADDGGSRITAYRVVILKEIKNENITDPGIISLSVGDLERNTMYTVKMFAKNAVFEGPAAEKKVKTKYEGVPAAARIDDLPNEVRDDTITLKWSEPQNNGKVITQYTVYQRIVTDGKPGDWIELNTITDVSFRESIVQLESGKVYEFVVTATNEVGESFKEDGKIMKVKASGASASPTMASNNKGLVPSTIASKKKGSSSNETTLHIVYNIIIIVLLIVILILIILLRRLRSDLAISRRNRQNVSVGCEGELVVMNTMASEAPEQSSSIVPSGDSRTYAAPSIGDYMPLHPSTRSWEINREQVKVFKIIGKGAFSQVAKASLWNISGNENYSTVAVKMLKANAPDSDKKGLLSELEVMKKLKPHPHVIKLIGCVTESDPLLVIIEYVPYGDLLGFLRKSRGLNDTYFKDPDVKPHTNLTAEQLMRFAWQVADGMFYLSSRKIIHRDLAARNVLVGEGEKCKVTDFGMARNVHQDDIYTIRTQGRLPVKWTAYEALLYGTYTTQSDVWSYGVLLYEILTVGGSPYPGIHARQIARKLQEGFRMPKPKHVDTKLYQIMLKCWEQNPSDRPTFANLKDTMKEMERNHRTYVNLKQYDNHLYANVEDLTAE